jgi:hypothetical protein
LFATANIPMLSLERAWRVGCYRSLSYMINHTTAAMVAATLSSDAANNDTEIVIRASL